MNNKKRHTSDCTQTNVTCIKWNLPPIPCLGIETGDMLDDITFALVKKICDATAGEDLSTIELQCLIDTLDIIEPPQRTIATFLQLAFDNDCKLYDLIQEVRNLISQNNQSLILDLKCLTQYDAYGNPLPYNEQSVLQTLITEACVIRGQITGLSEDISEINIRIDNLPPTYQEPNILNECLYSGTRPLSQAHTLLASDYCSYKLNIGTIPEIQTSISQICDEVKDEYILNSDFFQNVSNLAQSHSNQWIATCDILNRVKALELCACKVKCDDIKIGFEVFDDDTDNASINLTFSPEYGFSLPVGAIPQEVKITFIDKNKKQLSFTVADPQTNFINGFSPIYNISSLNLDGVVVIKVCTKIQINGTEICCDCNEKEHMFVGTCAYCEIKATDQKVTIIYRTCNNNI